MSMFIGRVANRIKEGRFTLNSREYQLHINNGVNHLHGGRHGFDEKIWCITPLSSGRIGVSCECESKDGEENYPGNMKVRLRRGLYV